MKLFYDNLYPFMPNSRIIDDKPVIDPKLDAARKAMIMLAEFQNTQNLTALYESINQISIYSGVDVVDLILSLGDVSVIEGTADTLLDIAAKNLFKTIAVDYDPKTFDYKHYTAILLSVAHALLDAQRKSMISEIAPIETSDEMDSTDAN